MIRRPTLLPAVIPEPPLPADRADALRLLQLPATADEQAVKRAFRRLVRDHHPDVGGEAAVFHELKRAYELLLGDAPAAPPATAGRPSRPRAAWTAERDSVAARDLEAVDWDLALPDRPCTLDRDLAARWLAAGTDGSLRPLVATSRAPGSRLNRSAPKLSTDLTSTLTVAPDRDDRGRAVVAATIRADNRKGRRALEAAALDGGWIRRRGTAATVLRRVAPLDDDRRLVALRTADAVAALLDQLAWPLSSWVLTPAR